MVSGTQVNFYTGFEIYLSVRNGSALEFSLTNDATKNLRCWKIIIVRKKICSILACTFYFQICAFFNSLASHPWCHVFCSKAYVCYTGLQGHPKSSTCSKSNFLETSYIRSSKTHLLSQYCKGIKKILNHMVFLQLKDRYSNTADTLWSCQRQVLVKTKMGAQHQA